MLSIFSINVIVETEEAANTIKGLYNLPFDVTSVTFEVACYNDYYWLDEYISENILYSYDGNVSNTLNIEDLLELRDYCQQLIAKDSGDMVEVMNVIGAIDDMLKYRDNLEPANDQAFYYVEYHSC